jgi:hypothetical protein
MLDMIYQKWCVVVCVRASRLPVSVRHQLQAEAKVVTQVVAARTRRELVPDEPQLRDLARRCHILNIS